MHAANYREEIRRRWEAFLVSTAINHCFSTRKSPKFKVNDLAGEPVYTKRSVRQIKGRGFRPGTEAWDDFVRREFPKHRHDDLIAVGKEFAEKCQT